MENKKIKILYIIPRFVTAGAERMVLHYARLLNKNQFEVAVASTVEDGPLSAQFQELGIRVFVGSSKKAGGRLAVARQLTKFVLEYKPDIIHTHLLGADVFGWYFKTRMKLGMRWISTQHNVEFNTPLHRRLIWKHILKSTDHIIAVAEKVKRYDINVFKLKEKNITVIKTGIDTKHFAAIKPLEINTAAWRLGIIGRLEKQKGHTYLIKALGSLKSKNWQLHIFGEGSDRTTLEALAQSERVNDKIIWEGVSANPVQMYESLDLVIQPSLWEGLSQVTIEAMAAGRGIIASGPAAEELIINKQNGLVVKTADVKDLADSLEYAFTHEQEIKAIAESARIDALAQFDISKNLKAHEKLYLSIF